MEKQVNRPKIKKGNILVYLVLILGSVLMIFPFIWMISTSFKTVPETTLIPPTLLPASFSNTAAYEQVTKSLPFFNLYFNTIMMIVIRVICAVVYGSVCICKSELSTEESVFYDRIIPADVSGTGVYPAAV